MRGHGGITALGQAARHHQQGLTPRLLQRHPQGPLKAVVIPGLGKDLEVLAMGLEAHRDRLRPQGRADGLGAEQHRVHHRHSRQALLQQRTQVSLTAAGAHHDVGSGVEQAHLQRRLQVHRALGAEQQHRPGMGGSGLAQHMGQAHVPQGETPLQALMEAGVAPLGRLQIHAGQGHIETEQALQTGLAQGSQAAHQHDVGIRHHQRGPAA